MKDWMLYFIIIPRRMLKEKMDYLARIEALKWDIWYYYTGIQLIITYFLIFAMAIGLYFWLATNSVKYIDPFKVDKMVSYIFNGILILLTFVLNRKFILKDAERDDIIDILKKIIVVSVIFFIMCMLSNFFVNKYINENIDEFYTANSIQEKEENAITLFFAPWTFEEKTIYKVPFISINIIQYLIYILMIYNNITWLYRLIKQKDVLNKTDIMFDEEENVKF